MDRMVVAKELMALAKELVAMDFPTQEAMDAYLKEHPDADRSNHRVRNRYVQVRKPDARPTLRLTPQGWRPCEDGH